MTHRLRTAVVEGIYGLQYPFGKSLCFLHLVDGARQKENKLGASFSPWAFSASLAYIVWYSSYAQRAPCILKTSVGLAVGWTLTFHSLGLQVK